MPKGSRQVPLEFSTPLRKSPAVSSSHLVERFWAFAAVVMKNAKRRDSARRKFIEPPNRAHFTAAENESPELKRIKTARALRGAAALALRLRLRLILEAALRTALIGIDVSELGAEIEQLRGVINPREDDHNGPGGTVRGHLHTFSDVKTDEKFSNGE